MSYHYTRIRTAKVRNIDHAQCCKDLEKLVLIHGFCECKMAQIFWGEKYIYVYILQYLPYDSAVTLLGIYLQEIKMYFPQKHVPKCSGAKFWISLGLLVGAVINQADKNLCMISVKGITGQLNRLPAAGVDDMVMALVKKGIAELRKKVHAALVI